MLIASKLLIKDKYKTWLMKNSYRLHITLYPLTGLRGKNHYERERQN